MPLRLGGGVGPEPQRHRLKRRHTARPPAHLDKFVEVPCVGAQIGRDAEPTSRGTTAGFFRVCRPPLAFITRIRVVVRELRVSMCVSTISTYVDPGNPTLDA